MKKATKVTALLLSGALLAGCQSTENKEDDSKKESQPSEALTQLQKDFQDKDTNDALQALFASTLKATNNAITIEQKTSGTVPGLDADYGAYLSAVDDNSTIRTDLFPADSKLYTCIDDGTTLSYGIFADGVDRTAILANRDGASAILADYGEMDVPDSTTESLEEATLYELFSPSDLLAWNPVQDTKFESSFELKGDYALITLKGNAEELSNQLNAADGVLITTFADAPQASVKELTYTISVNDKGFVDKIEKKQSIDFTASEQTVNTSSTMTATIAPYMADTDLKETIDYVFSQIDQGLAWIGGSISLDHAAAGADTTAGADENASDGTQTDANAENSEPAAEIEDIATETIID